MATLTLQLNPDPIRVALLGEPQLCYVLLTINASGSDRTIPINWALVADASRSMRIPIVDEQQFRALVHTGGARETLVDGVPVWQLTGPVPPEVRAVAPSALEHVARALHTVVERLDGEDRFALVACAEDAVLLVASTSGAERVRLVEGLARLKSLNLGEQTDLARGIELALKELHRGHDSMRAERLLLLTDGFTLRPEACLQLASLAANEGIAISTVGLGGEFQEQLLIDLADRSGGRAVFLNDAREIPRAITAELAAARSVVARAVTLQVALESGVAIRRVTRIRPTLTPLYENAGPLNLPLGDLDSGAPVVLLLELMAPSIGYGTLGRVRLASTGSPVAEVPLLAIYQDRPAPLAPEVLDAAARASAARLQRRALDAATAGSPAEAARLLRAAGERFAALGERALADIARAQSQALEQTGHASAMATKELTYATRRLGETK